MNKYYLETQMLSKKYGQTYAVNKVNIHVKQGDIYGLIGPNGAGKTTLMKMISGFATPTEGEVQLFSEEDRTRRIGVLIENPGLYGNMNAFENMRLRAVAMGVYDRKNIMEILDFVGLSGDLKKKTGKYSLGMKQRLGIGFALIGHPDFLILDEPINGLDPQGIAEVRELILELNRKESMTIMISSHILEELGKVATTFGIIEKGRLILELSQAQLKQQCEERVEIVSTDNGRVAITLEGMGIRQYRVISADTVYAYGCMQRVDEISRQLVERGVAIRRIGVAGTSLEDFYLNTLKGGVFMATSSITKNFIISGQKQVEMFADAIEESANDRTPRVPINVTYLQGADDIIKFMEKRKKTDAASK